MSGLTQLKLSVFSCVCPLGPGAGRTCGWWTSKGLAGGFWVNLLLLRTPQDLIMTKKLLQVLQMTNRILTNARYYLQFFFLVVV